MWRLVEILRSMDLEVTYATIDLVVSEPWAGRLAELGVAVLRRPFSRSLKRHLRRHGSEYDLVWLCRVSVAGPLVGSVRRHCPRARVIFDTVDLHFLREKREAELSEDASALSRAGRTRERELSVVRQVDSTILVSAEEARLIGEACPDAELRVVSMIHDPVAEVADFEARKGLLFVGGFEHRPNRDGVEWFVAKILPRIRERLPETPFWIVGTGATDRGLRVSGPGVTVIGWVLELDSVYARSRLSVAPLRYGAGVKGKLTQSLARGLPCVATSLACEGMPLTHGLEVLIADDEQSFADAVARLHEDRTLWRSLSSAGQAVVAEHYSRDRARTEMADLLSDLDE